MKLAGLAEFMAEAWAALGEGIALEIPKGNDEAASAQKKLTLLGCEHRMVERSVNMPNGEMKDVRGV